MLPQGIGSIWQLSQGQICERLPHDAGPLHRVDADVTPVPFAVTRSARARQRLGTRPQRHHPGASIVLDRGDSCEQMIGGFGAACHGQGRELHENHEGRGDLSHWATRLNFPLKAGADLASGVHRTSGIVVTGARPRSVMRTRQDQEMYAHRGFDSDALTKNRLPTRQLQHPMHAIVCAW